MHAMIVVAVYYACKRSTMYMCVHVCVQVCVYVCIHNVHVCTCVCAWLSVCVCACQFCTNQLQSLYSSPKSDYSCSQLVTDSNCYQAANTKEERADDPLAHQVSQDDNAILADDLSFWSCWSFWSPLAISGFANWSCWSC